MASRPVCCWVACPGYNGALFRMGVAYSGALPLKRLTFGYAAYIITQMQISFICIYM